jgi:hypothetical protein
MADKEGHGQQEGAPGSALRAQQSSRSATQDACSAWAAAGSCSAQPAPWRPICTPLHHPAPPSTTTAPPPGGAETYPTALICTLRFVPLGGSVLDTNTYFFRATLASRGAQRVPQAGPNCFL